MIRMWLQEVPAVPDENCVPEQRTGLQWASKGRVDWGQTEEPPLGKMFRCDTGGQLIYRGATHQIDNWICDEEHYCPLAVSAADYSLTSV